MTWGNAEVVGQWLQLIESVAHMFFQNLSLPFRIEVKPGRATNWRMDKRAAMTSPTAQPEDLPSLYRRAFKEYGRRALWNMRPIEDPTPDDALAITKALRTHGGMDGRRLAEHIERLCRASH